MAKKINALARVPIVDIEGVTGSIPVTSTISFADIS